MAWIIQNQLGRRNLQPYQRGEVELEAVSVDTRKDATYVLPGGKTYSLATVARFLGWVKPSDGRLLAHRLKPLVEGRAKASHDANVAPAPYFDWGSPARERMPAFAVAKPGAPRRFSRARADGKVEKWRARHWVLPRARQDPVRARAFHELARLAGG